MVQVRDVAGRKVVNPRGLRAVSVNNVLAMDEDLAEEHLGRTRGKRVCGCGSHAFINYRYAHNGRDSNGIVR